MLRKEMTKVEIERELAGKGDYVLIDNMTRFLKENLPLDIRKFVMQKLVAVYERRNMFFEAGSVYDRLIELAITPGEKASYSGKSAESYIKSGQFDKADLSMKKIPENVKATEKTKMNSSMKNFYKKQAEQYEKEKRRNMAMRTYEKILTLGLPETEKTEVEKKLMNFYRELGLVKQYMAVKAKLA
jgi:tetratricopeptide (TPR) repeat protein